MIAPTRNPSPTSSIEPRWVHPSRILFAAASNPDERGFAYALTAAQEYGAKLILLYVFDVLATATEDVSGAIYFESAMRRAAEKLEPLKKRAETLGVEAEIVVHSGIAASRILETAQKSGVDRIVMGTRAPGRIGKFFTGSVAEEVLRSASVPVVTLGPNALDPKVHGHTLRRILCTASHLNCELQPVLLAGRIAEKHDAELTILHLITPREESPLDPGCSTATLEAELKALLPRSVDRQILIRSLSTAGSVGDEIVFQTRQRRSDLVILGAHPATTLETIARQGMVNQVLAQSLCPVMTLKHAIPRVWAPQLAEPDLDYFSESTWLGGIF
jgi:nucleotide-binding universal stress UspA family protein